MSDLTPKLKALPEGLGFFHPTALISTWFGCGLLRPAPGTWGTIGALPFAWVLLSLGSWPLLLIVTIIMFWFGVKAAHAYAKAEDGKDPQSVVVDEVLGVWVALLAAPLTFEGFFIGFIAFRFYDILKPWPVSWADNEIEGGLGIVLDDIFAGVYAFVVVLLYRLWFA